MRGSAAEVLVTGAAPAHPERNGLLRTAWPVFVLATVLTVATAANAQSRGSGVQPARRKEPSLETPGATAAGTMPSEARGLRAGSGAEVASRLLRSADAGDRLRGLERAAHTHTAEAFALLERAAAAGVGGAQNPRVPLEGLARSDPRALLTVVHGLASWTESDHGRAALAALASLAGAPAQSFVTRPVPRSNLGADDGQGAARIQLARHEAAVAMAKSGNVVALETLIALSRSGGPGQGAALVALTMYPPAPPVLGGVTLTTPATASLAAAIGDLQSFDGLEGATRASDPALRASAIVALGQTGDARAVEIARNSVHDPDARVRLSAGEALVRLAAPEAPQVIAQLIGDDVTAVGALRLAQVCQGEPVVKAAAAVAVASANPDLRAAAVAALGRQIGATAVVALSTIVADPALQGDAACALARLPNPSAMQALEAMADEGTQRLAARAYMVRRLARGEYSARLDELLSKLADSADARNRAVGLEALVATGERPVAGALADRDARVRRAVAAGALARWDPQVRAALLDRMTLEQDPATREVLALGLLDGDPEARVPTEDLVQEARAGGPDAPLAVLSLARRIEAGSPASREIDALLASPDPVLREHAARGMGAGAAPEGIGRLAQSYRWETDVHVRRAIVAALAGRDGGGNPSPARDETLALAAQLDPDTAVRRTAERGLSGLPERKGGAHTEVAWLRLLAAPGAASPENVVAALVSSDGLALPIAFDDDGFALLPGLPPGPAILRLAPRVPPYEPASP